MTDQLDLEGLERAAKAATPGPWTVIPPEPYDGDEPELEGSFVYPGGVEDANGNAVCAFGWAGGSGHMFEAPGNPPYLAAWNPATALSILSRLRASEAECERLAAYADKAAESSYAMNSENFGLKALATSQAEAIKRLEAEISRQRNGDRRATKEVISLHRARGPGIARLRASPAVLIQSDNGFWREGGCGYTDEAHAAVYTGADAHDRTRHCGPEKEVRYHVLVSTRTPSGEARPDAGSDGGEGV